VAYFSQTDGCFDPSVLEALRTQIVDSPHLVNNNLTADFVGTRGFSIVFTRAGVDQVLKRFPAFQPYIAELLDPDCNAFYLNPLVLVGGSQVNPHIDRSLRAYCKTVDTPQQVSVLYVEVPADLRGGELVLHHGHRKVGRVVPQANRLVRFQGDLSHDVTPVGPHVTGRRISLVCEQYWLEPDVLAQIPSFKIEQHRKTY
jgi:hypothetical protein